MTAYTRKTVGKRTAADRDIFADGTIQRGRGTAGRAGGVVQLQGFRNIRGFIAAGRSIACTVPVQSRIADPGITDHILKSDIGDRTVLYAGQFNMMGTDAFLQRRIPDGNIPAVPEIDQIAHLGGGAAVDIAVPGAALDCYINQLVIAACSFLAVDQHDGGAGSLDRRPGCQFQICIGIDPEARADYVSAGRHPDCQRLVRGRAPGDIKCLLDCPGIIGSPVSLRAVSLIFH